MEARFRPFLVGLLSLAVPVVPTLPSDLGASAVPAVSGNDNGSFHVYCQLSRRAMDDPIVFPRARGMSHMHDFFGPRVSAFSTNKSIRRAATTCVRDDVADKADHSAYWMPTVYDGNVALRPESIIVYYRTGFRPLGAIKPFPKNLRMIGGDPTAATQPKVGAEPAINFVCQGPTVVPASRMTAPTCAVPLIDLVIRFPDCWDGVHTDSRNHRSHMAYSRLVPSEKRASCPATHPVPVPALRLTARYRTIGGPALRLASGEVDTAHADFMNGWNMRKLSTLVNRCLKRDKYCGGGSVPVPGHQEESATGPGI